jgi:hypothetical protein
MDYRKADPTYIGFKPKLASEAIDLFFRHKKRGIPPNLWPEVFVDCSKDLPAEELTKFEAWLVNPQGEAKGVPLKEGHYNENEALRQKLVAEAVARDLQALSIEEETFSSMRVEADSDDEKTPVPQQPPSIDEDHFDMIKPSAR